MRDSHGNNGDRSAEHQRGYDRISVPMSTVATYTERASLSRELIRKLEKPFRGAGLAHGVTIIGLGGTGKTQLVLHYIESNETKYDAVFWIDAQSEETARSSFERCCRQLSLPIQGSADKRALYDSPFVHKLFHWLSSRREGQEWLMIIDNADDMTWDMSAIIPKGCVGSVIVTSQDREASRLICGKSDILSVDAMETDQAVSLLLSAMSVESGVFEHDTKALLERVVQRLDRLPLAVDLAGARIYAAGMISTQSQSPSSEQNLKTTLREYLRDLEYHQDRVLKSEGSAGATRYKNTLWTVWETSLSSLRKIEQRETGLYPEQLLIFMTRFDRTCIQEELFRQASCNFVATRERLQAEVPAWLKELLDVGEDGQWDSYVYRHTIQVLERFGLVRRVQGLYPGVTMHGLVKWRAALQNTTSEHQTRFFVFLVATCYQSSNGAIPVELKRHIMLHLPTVTDLTKDNPTLSDEGLAWAWMFLSSLYSSEGQWGSCVHLREASCEMRKRLLGGQHPDTLLSMSKLAQACYYEGLYQKAEEMGEQAFELQRRVLGEHHPDTNNSRRILMAVYYKLGRSDEKLAREDREIVEARPGRASREHMWSLEGNHHPLVEESLLEGFDHLDFFATCPPLQPPTSNPRKLSLVQTTQIPHDYTYSWDFSTSSDNVMIDLHSRGKQLIEVAPGRRPPDDRLRPSAWQNMPRIVARLPQGHAAIAGTRVFTCSVCAGSGREMCQSCGRSGMRTPPGGGRS
jgi:hypothetical protein